MRSFNLFHIKFLDGSYEEAFSRLKQGDLMVVPSGPGLATIDQDNKYYSALRGAAFAIADSGFMVILLRLFFGYKIKKLSGLKFFRAFIKEKILQKEGTLFCIDSSESELHRNNKYLNRNFVFVHIVPFYFLYEGILSVV